MTAIPGSAGITPLTSAQTLPTATGYPPAIPRIQLSSTTPLGRTTGATMESTTSLAANDEYFRKSYEDSERRRQRMEEENAKLLEVMNQVSEDLRAAKSPAPSRASKEAKE